MQNQKVYTVKGSEDGLLGVMSNMTKAYERACQYFSDCNEPITIDDKKATQKRFNETFKKNYYVSLECDWLSVEVNLFILNQ